MFAKQGGLTNLTTAVYKGTAPALTDVAGGHVQIQIDSIVSLQGMAKSGKVKPIIVTSAKRSAVMPNVPTAVESGYPKFVTESWYGVWAPKNTPNDRVQFLNKAINEAVSQLAKAGAFEPGKPKSGDTVYMCAADKDGSITNTSTADVLAPADVLTGMSFASNLALSLTAVSAVV